MTFTSAEERRIAKMEDLFTRQAGRFCWADLALLAVSPRTEAQVNGSRVLHRAVDDGAQCRDEAARDGQCYCGAMKAADLVRKE